MTKEQVKNEQTGRSMVEMLGVLAIIGVLSVGGIYGYTIAMKKHKANELLNEASKRAVVVAAQIASGKSGSALSIAEFTENEFYGATFGEVVDNGDGTFTLKLTHDDNFDVGVCTQMHVVVGDTHLNPTINTDCTELKYNGDLGETTAGTGGSTEPTIEEDVEVENCEKEKYNSGTWDSGSEYNGTGLDYTNEITPSGRCRCSETTPVWDGNACIEKPTKICNSEKKCDSGEYCRYYLASLSVYLTNSHRFPHNWSDGTEIDGICTKVSGIKKTGNFYYNLYDNMDWFSASNWCKAIGKNLISYETLTQAPFNCNYENFYCDTSSFEMLGLGRSCMTARLSSEYDGKISGAVVINGMDPICGYSLNAGGMPLCE